MNDWYEAERRSERAQQLSESQRWAEALSEIDAALTINPNNASWHAQRGYLLEELDRSEESIEAYAASLALEPGDRDVSTALALALIRSKRFARALEVLEEIARVYPGFEPAYCHRIAAYTELGLHDQAEQMFYLAQEINPSCPHCFYHIGVSLALRGQTDRAIYCWQKVLEIDPEYIGVNRQMARACRANGELEKARNYLLNEVRNDPGDVDLLFELAELTLESGQVATAAAKFAQILELDPDYYEARFALGKVWLLRGQPERALTCFAAIPGMKEGIAELPGLSQKVGEALYRLERCEEAREFLHRAAEEEPDNPAVQIMLGNCLLAVGKPESAADCFRRVLATDADHPYALHNLGVSLFQLGRHEAGLHHCLQAIRAKPDYVTAMHNAVIACIHTAKWSQAKVLLRRALEIEPENAILKRFSKRLWRFRIRHTASLFAGFWRRLGNLQIR